MDDAGQANVRLLGMLICQAAPGGPISQKNGNQRLVGGFMKPRMTDLPLSPSFSHLEMHHLPALIQFAQLKKVKSGDALRHERMNEQMNGDAISRRQTSPFLT
jgi:hypothetical protein